MSSSIVRQYYSTQIRQEWHRLIQDAYHRLELDTTLFFLEKHLPKNGLLLDAGCGPGRYTLELARRGYWISDLDLTPAFLEFARRQMKKNGLSANVREYCEGTLTDLSHWKDDTFDGVVCLGGPLSHLIDRKARAKAIRELIRVAKPGAPIFASVMSRLSVLVVELMLFQHEIGMKTHQSIRKTGKIDGTTGFTACHFYLPEELKAEFDLKSVEFISLTGLEGLGSHHRRKINELARHEQRWKDWLVTHYETCNHPPICGGFE
ncbi:MAG: class I SAM-dependent methyltransferase [Anaerolineaceae bacterium]|nr:class I SAM-dependent methyltransferase [Anaerolineaceae bacterium]